jgi:hypothetical protein
LEHELTGRITEKKRVAIPAFLFLMAAIKEAFD